MTQQSDTDPATVLHSLRAKLQEFADRLSREETEQLRAMETEEVTGILPPSLREKVQRTADALTPDEAIRLVRFLRRASVGTATGEEADTRGHMRRQSLERESSDQPGGSLDQYTLGQIGIGFLGFVSSVAALGTPRSSGTAPPSP